MLIVGKKVWRQRLTYLSVAMIFALTVYVGLYLALKNSNAYLCAIDYLNKSNPTNVQFGRITRVYMIPLNFYFHGDGADGKANMDIYVVGSKENGKIRFFLKQESGKWNVQEARSI